MILASRNFLFDKGFFKVSETKIPSIGIGNLTVGGTGKTPHIEYFIRYFKDSKEIATLSRGYGRKTKGFLAVKHSMTAEQTGDEPWQFFIKFGHQIKVNVGEKRAPAADNIHELYPDVNLLLMDDVFQHRAVKPDFSILLCDYTRPFFQDYPFPAGRLREFRTGARRANAIIVSKCPPDISREERASFIHRLKFYAPSIPVAFSMFAYGEVVSVFNTSSRPARWLLVTGIARPQSLVEYLQAQHMLLEHLQYADHHDFSEAESQEVLHTFQKLNDKDAGILITEKDYARLSPAIKEVWKQLPLFYIPIAVEFIEGKELLLQNIQQALDRKV
jgi:tetraacyldisaccharide 4'-kinase